MKKYLNGFIFSGMIILIFFTSGCSRIVSDDLSTRYAPLSGPNSMEDTLVEEITTSNQETGRETQTNPQITQKTEEALAPEEEMLAEMSQGELVNAIDLSVKTIILYTESLLVSLDSPATEQPFSGNDMEQVAINIDRAKDQIDQTGEQLEVYYFLYGEKQDDFITFLYGLEEELDSVLVSVISLSEIIKNDQYSGAEQSVALSEITGDMKIQLENLQVSNKRLLTSYEMINELAE